MARPKVLRQILEQLHLGRGAAQQVDAPEPATMTFLDCSWFSLACPVISDVRRKAVAHLALLALVPTGHEIEMPNQAADCFPVAFEFLAVVKRPVWSLTRRVEVARVDAHAAILVERQPLVRVRGRARNRRTRRSTQ